MKATSFRNLLLHDKVAQIEVPIIQRDYAQGRHNPEAARIRNAFLSVLHSALAGGRPVHLDFVYGHIEDGKLVPLDGQQRLTTLFLLHWYLGAHAAVEDAAATHLPSLTYETRRSSRRFCQMLIAQRPFPLPQEIDLSDWIRNQSWFASSWRHDPTIASMLVVLNAIHDRFGGADCVTAWQRLVDPDSPAITFDFLPIENLGLTEDLYIKMNSRGKPLTTFENLKAEFEGMVRGISESRHGELCSKIDNQWADVFWKLRGSEKIIDDLFLRYFCFVTDALGYWTKHDLQGSPLDRARSVYAGSEANLGLLFDAFDVWVPKKESLTHGEGVRAWFEDVFTKATYEPGKVALFDDVDLLRACTSSYDSGGIFNRFPLWKQLLLFAVVQHLRAPSTDFRQRIRYLRNLVLNSTNEMRQGELPTLLEEVSQLVASGSSPVRGFNRRQVAEEDRKVALLATQPVLADPLRRLEDHPLLQGCLASFDLSATNFERRAAVFDEVFSRTTELPVPATTAALLACGDYAQPNSMGRFQFGAEKRGVWRDLLTKGAPQTRTALETLLDAVGIPDHGSINERVNGVAERYLAAQEVERAFDWRYYFVKYDEMRTGNSGIYAGSSGPMSFRLCMLNKMQMNSKYRDPFLLAIYRRSGADKDGEVVDPWFTGYANVERWLELGRGGVAITCTEEGFVLRAPKDEAFDAAFKQVASSHGMESEGLVRVPQLTRNGAVYDTEDRVLFGVRLVTDLLTMRAIEF
jgi:hypothetical protein